MGRFNIRILSKATYNPNLGDFSQEPSQYLATEYFKLPLGALGSPQEAYNRILQSHKMQNLTQTSYNDNIEHDLSTRNIVAGNTT